VAFWKNQISELQYQKDDITNEEFNSQIESLTSIKGISPAIATSLIMSTGEFTLFSSAKKYAKYIGFCPSYQKSGTSLKTKSTINRNEDSELRSTLYVASWSAIRFNAACKEMYERLKSTGNPIKVALIAVIKKLM
jgi:transposase